MRTRSARTLLVVALSVVALGAWGAPAAASCAPDDRPIERKLAEAEVAFVGTATEVTNNRRTAVFEVDEVWVHSPGVPRIGPEVTVHGGPDDTNAGTSVDRTWEAGERYLVLPHVDGQRLVDDTCTATQLWTGELTDARPAGAREVSEGDDLDDVAVVRSTPWIVAGVTILAAVVAGAYLLARRR